MKNYFRSENITNEPYITRKKKGIEYLNLSSSFDIETSSFYEGEEKRAILYAFVFGINGKLVFGRTWEDFLSICNDVQKAYGLNEKKRLIVYIHNEGYEFQFMRKWLEWLNVFATDERKPCKALSSFGIEFRDSYILSGMGLASTAKDLTKYKIEKLTGELDYSLLRHSKTKLTPNEWHYIENDGLSLMAFIQEEIERNGNNITNIPLTKTGYVRRYARNMCYHNGQAGHGERRKVKGRFFESYKKIMQRLTIEPLEYLLAKEVFQGGFTHANCFNVGLVFDDVASMDLTSAYPASMVLDDNYPMGKGTFVQFPSPAFAREKCKYYACMFRVAMKGVRSKMKGDNFLSFSKCRNLKNYEIDNGRIMEAEYLETSLTNIDLEILEAFYEIDNIAFFDFWYYPRGFLPKQFIKAILGLYADKTTLKGIEGMEAEYMLKKGMLNSTFGMSVTSIDFDNQIYEDDIWSSESSDLGEAIEKYNNSTSRFLFYPWGVFVTANVRKTIARAILNLGDDYIYADTDSVKFTHLEKHKKFFDDYNAFITRKIAYSSDFNKLDVNLFKPKDKNGLEHVIGVFDYEGTYKRFKTLGAKRYFVEYPEPHKFKCKDGKTIETPYNLTISGVNKSSAIPTLLEKSKEENKDIFDYFDIGMVYTAEMTGKQTHTYCDFEIKGTLTDYRGVKARYYEKSFIHLEGATYKMTTTEEYSEVIYCEQLERKRRREERKIK